MPRKPSNYPRMRQLGQWISDFVNTPPLSHDIEERIDGALGILNVDHHKRGDDPVLQALMHAYDDSGIASKYFDTTESVKLSRELYGVDTAKYSDDEKMSIRSEVIHTLLGASFIREALWRIYQNGRKSWEYTLSTPSVTSPRPDSLAAVPNDLLTRLLERYNAIQKTLIVQERQIKIVNRFVPNKESSDYSKWVKPSALVSKMLIDFLRLGGEDYCSICKNCKELLIAERKGRRVFCSDRCRVAYKRKKDDLRGVIQRQ